MTPPANRQATSYEPRPSGNELVEQTGHVEQVAEATLAVGVLAMPHVRLEPAVRISSEWAGVTPGVVPHVPLVPDESGCHIAPP